MLHAVTLCQVVLLTQLSEVFGVHDQQGHYVNQFVIETKGGPSEAREIAMELGFVYHEPVSSDIIMQWASTAVNALHSEFTILSTIITFCSDIPKYYKSQSRICRVKVKVE